jgi:hypothetical protein
MSQYRLMRRVNGLGISEYQLEYADGVKVLDGRPFWQPITEWVNEQVAISALLDHYAKSNLSEPEEYADNEQLMTLITIRLKLPRDEAKA